MTYLFCALFMQILAIRQFFLIVTPKQASATPGAQLAGAGICLAAGLFGMPIILEVTQAMAFADGKPVSMGGDFRALWFMGAGALITLMAFTHRMLALGRTKTPHFLAVGANVFGLLVGLYVAFVVTDQLSFYYSRKDSGMLSWALMKEDPTLREISCESDFLIVRGMDTGIATYRCPTPLQLVYGRLSGAPIVPWPGYSEGKSAALAQALKKLQNEAIRIQETK